jgi:hypothetical protein
MKLSQELIGILAVGVTLMGMLVAVFVSMGRMETRLRQDIGVLREDMGVLREDVRHDIDGLRADIQDIREDVRQLRDMLLVPAASPPASSPIGQSVSGEPSARGPRIHGNVWN